MRHILYFFLQTFHSTVQINEEYLLVGEYTVQCEREYSKQLVGTVAYIKLNILGGITVFTLTKF